jgi:hypothetical protein
MDDNLYECSLNYNGIDTALSYLISVEHLYLDNYINTDKREFLGPGFRNMTSLESFTVKCNYCHLRKLLNSTFVNLGQITLLNISGCDINGRYFEAGSLSPLTNLTTLDISKNRGIGMDHLPIIMHGLNNSNLQYLQMNRIVRANSITIINTSLAKFLSRTLTTLAARENNILLIDRNAVLKLPTSLRTIDVRDNMIFTHPENIPIQHFVQLKTLMISTSDGGCVNVDEDNILSNDFVKQKITRNNTHTC